MSVFTIYCHGSGGHRYKDDKEIVANFGRRAQLYGQEYKDFLILDGVGGFSKSKKHPALALAGSFDWADKQRRPKGNTPAEMGGGKGTTNSKIGSVRANASGEGVEDNARHALIALLDLHVFPTTINLIGWSRGAVTALVTANMLHDFCYSSGRGGILSGTTINIFAIDPVAGKDAGIGPNSDSRRRIPSSVSNYVGILATGENRQTFKPQDLSRVYVVDANASNVIFLPFPGKHSTVAQNCDKRATDVSDIVWTLANRFLSHFGTVQGTIAPLTTREGVLDSYSKIVLQKDKLAEIKQEGLTQRIIGMGFGTRELTTRLKEYTKYEDYFVNEHHRKFFKVTAPEVYNWLFTTRYDSGTFPRTVFAGSALYQELDRLRAWKHFMQYLEKLGVKREQTTAFNLPPARKFYKATAKTQRDDIQCRANLLNMGLIW